VPAVLRRGVILAIALIGLAGAPAAAEAVPTAGWWGGARDGYDVQFLVVHSGGRALVQDASVRCDSLIWTGDERWEFGAESRPVAARVGQRGKIGKGRRIDEFGLHRRATVVKGQLKRRTGYVHPPVFGTGCETKLKWSSRIAVRPLAAPPRPAITDGRWLLKGPELTETELTFVVTGGGAKTSIMSGVIGGGRRPGPLGPVTCKNLGDVIDPAAVAGDGSFLSDNPRSAPDATASRVVGRFADASSANGTYTLETLDDSRGFARCLTGSWPWTAELLEPEAPPPGVLPAPARQLSWAALGDSYSSGEGVRPFFKGTEGRRNKCHRSHDAYSQVFHLSGYEFFRKDFLACSGAVTDNVGRFDASGGLTGVVQHNEPGVQLAQLTPDAWRQTDFVTLTIGGNDAGFGSVLTQCVFLRCHRGARARKIRRKLTDEVPGKLRTTYAALRQLAPQATVVVLGYPNLFPARGDFRRGCDLQRTVSADKRQFIRELGQQLNDILRRETHAAGLHFTDPRDEFKGHEPCGRKEEWVNAIVRRRFRELPEGLSPTSMTSFHPNRRGQRAYADVLAGYLKCALTSGWAYRPDTGLPQNPAPGGRRPRCG
jgi:lysophospholipase L1-like esterase